ncbi:Protein kinase domain-containing protein [Amycolatopsis marina]|uniref:non-specific serine/threonine protein kinase n=1 Tax=Amycolatopsis marina TaxID=490629 RepID=A0A1I0W3Q3_9PSEU|nr:serine/threonine-protein kinase [Amycolatopsis marina]SFA83359.1 Protein kinase domain-containing protein [Amycolatopsis marina]
MQNQVNSGRPRLVAGRYAVLDELGRGGMGVVWRADDRVIGRQVALKELRAPIGAGAADRATYLERVLREARTAGRLNDPAVVTVFDVLPGQDVTYIVMELVSAPTLADLMARQGPLDAARVADIGTQVLGALRTAHAAGIVHRDVKPANIMVLPNGRVKLADFGIAKAMDDPSLTMTGGIMGSPGYMAPELFAGASPAPASDLWSLGATLFHAAEGHAPFQRDSTAATVHAIMYEQPQVRRCRGQLAVVVQGLLTQSVQDRVTAQRASALLSAVVSGGPDATEARPVEEVAAQYVGTATAVVPEGADTAPESKRRRGLLLVGAALAVVAVLGAIFLLPPDTEQKTTTVANAGDSEAAQQAEQADVPGDAAAPGAASGPNEQATPGEVAERAEAGTADKTGRSDESGGTGESAEDAGSGAERTESTALAPPPASNRELLPLSRYNHPRGAHFTGTANVRVPGGFSSEGVLGSLAAEPEQGTRKLYACTLAKRGGDWFSSIDQSGGCEGQRAVGLLGFIFDAAPDGVPARPLYRCNAGDSHFDSLNANCEGEVRELLLGYLITG